MLCLVRGRRFHFAFLAFLFLVIADPSYSQSRQMDSLRSVISPVPKDTNDVKNMVTLAMAMFHESTFDSALHLSIQARKLAEELNYKKGIGLALLASGYVYKLEGSYEASLKDLGEALILFEDITDSLNIGKSHSFIAQTYQSMGEPEKALIHLRIALAYVEKLGNKAGMSVIYLDIGRYHAEHSNYEVALEYYLLSLKASESIQAYSKMAVALNNIGVEYEHMEQLEKALQYFTRGLELTIKGNVVSKKSLLLINQAGVLIKLNKLDKAERALDEALLISEGNGDKEYRAIAFRNMGNLYKKKKMRSKAEEYFKRSIALGREINNPEITMNGLVESTKFFLHEGNVERAAVQSKEALEIALDLKSREYINEIYLLNSKIDSARGNYPEAFKWHKKFAKLNDSLLVARKTASIAYLQGQLDEQNVSKAEGRKVATVEAGQILDQKTYRARFILLFAALFITVSALIIVTIKLRGRNRQLEAMMREVTYHNEEP